MLIIPVVTIIIKVSQVNKKSKMNLRQMISRCDGMCCLMAGPLSEQFVHNPLNKRWSGH